LDENYLAAILVEKNVSCAFPAKNTAGLSHIEIGFLRRMLRGFAYWRLFI
jgi:hypothetical protein